MTLRHCVIPLLFPVLLAGASSVRMTPGMTGSVTGIAGMSSYAGPLRLEARFTCSPPNTGSIHPLIGIGNSLATLRWSWAPNRLEAHFGSNSGTGGNVAYLSTSGWQPEWELRLQQVSTPGAMAIQIEKWDSIGGGYAVQNLPISAIGSRPLDRLTLGSASVGCDVSYVRLYTTNVPLNSPPPSANANPGANAVLAIEFDDWASPASDASENGYSMIFSSMPTWIPEDTTPACWAQSANPAVAGAPVSPTSVNSYARDGSGSVTRFWQIISQPYPRAARLSGHTETAPVLLGAVRGVYDLSLRVTQSDGQIRDCALSQPVTAPAPGQGGLQKVVLGMKFDSVPNTAKVRARVLQPDGKEVVGSPFTCGDSPCTVYIDDTGLGDHLVQVERLNANGETLAVNDFRRLRLAKTPLAPPATQGNITSPHYQHIQTAQVSYAGGIPKHVRQWMGERFDWMIEGSPSPLPYNPAARWTTYKDYAAIYNPSEFWKIKDHAVLRGWNHEDYFLHMRVNYNNTQTWTKTAKFGDDNGTVASKGVMVYNGSTFTDFSEAAWNSTTADVPIGNNNVLYVGYNEPFDMINVNMSTMRAGGSVLWQYWSGTSAMWRSLAASDDQSGKALALSSSGQIRFTPPSDWSATAVNGSRNRWYVRAIVSGVSIAPVASRIYGDDWYTSGLARGWALTSGTRVPCCGGAYEYDPTPPDGSSARFRYQSRVRSFFGSTNDAFMMNCSAQNNGIRLWPRWLSDYAISQFTTGGHNGIMLDNGDTTVAEKITFPADWRSHMDWVEPYLNEQIVGFRQFYDDVKAVFPKSSLGMNSAYRTAISFEGDFTLWESFTTANVAEHNLNAATSASMTFDDCVDASLNPRNTVCIVVPHDTNHVDTLDTTTNTWYFWDRGDRRPMMMLAFYYIGANDRDHTAFYYNSVGTTYSSTSEVYYFTEGSVLLQDRPEDRTNALKTITVADAAEFPNSGTVQIGTLGEQLTYTLKAGNILSFTEPVYNSYAAGAPVKWVTSALQAERIVPLHKVTRWTNFFPAIEVDVGRPDSNGYNGGARDLRWALASAAGVDGGAYNSYVYRRDYTNAIVLLRPAYTNSPAARRNQCSAALDLGGGTYYRLHADGRTNPVGMTSIKLREGEGAILMKSPTSDATTAAEWQLNPCP